MSSSVDVASSSTTTSHANTNAIAPSIKRRIDRALKTKLTAPCTRAREDERDGVAPPPLSTVIAMLSDVVRASSKHASMSQQVMRESENGMMKTSEINVRRVVERRAGSLRIAYTDASLEAQSKLSQVESTLRALDEAREAMKNALERSRASTDILMREVEGAREAARAIEARAREAKEFAIDFQLSEAHVEALVGDRAKTSDDGREEELPETFFDALERVKVIQGNCAKTRDGDRRRAVVELMDAMTSYAEAAHERLCRWVVAKCRKLAEENDFITEIDEKTLKKSVQALRLRPTLFKHCVEEVTRTRHNALFRRFITALTRGGAGTKPIEVHAHDPMRYSSDMLSWVHQAVASEKDFCAVAFGEQSVVEIDGETFDASLAVLDKVFDAVARPLKVRVEQVLVSVSGGIEGGVITSYKLANLLPFYRKLFGDLLDEKATITRTLGELCATAKTSFADSVAQHGSKYKKLSLAPNSLTGDDALAPPPALREGVASAIELLEAVASSSSTSAGVSESESRELLASALDGLIDPILAAVAAAAHKLAERVHGGASSAAPKWAGDAFTLNALHAVREPLRAHRAASAKVEEIARLIAKKVSDVADAEADALLASSGLSDALELVVLYQEQASNGIMAKDPALKIERLATALSTLVDAAGTKAPDFVQIQAPAARRDVVARYNSRLIEAYTRVYAAVLNPSSGYSNPRASIRHGPDALSTVLGGY